VATTASPAAPISTHQGVPPLRAGQGHSFLLRKLHSLSGIIPVGAFLIEHFVSNAFATRGPGAYAKQVELLSSFPFVFYLELFGIWLPILYHALYGFYIWFRGESNVADYPWAGNKGQQFSQIGNAVPPLLAGHLLAPHLGVTLDPDDFALAA